METIRKSFNFKRDTKKGINTHTFTHNFKAPTGIAVKWQDERISVGKGLGCLQNYHKKLKSTIMQETITNLGVDTTTMTNGDNHSLINLATSSAKTVIDSVDEMDRMKALIETLEKEIEVMKDDANKVNDNAPEILTEDVVVTKFTDLNNADSEVRRRTGFQNLDHLLAYTILLCNGDFEKMLDKKTRLTWFEEWIFFFEYEWGRTIGRWWDAEAAMKIGRQRLMIIFQNKLDMSKTCRDSWPRYASFDEDFCLMKEKWKEKYEGERVVMWDDTNVNLSFQPNGAD